MHLWCNCLKLFTSGIPTFLQSWSTCLGPRISWTLSSVRWEEWAGFWPIVVRLVPREPFTGLHFWTECLAFFPVLCLSFFVTVRRVREASVMVDYPILYTVGFFSCFLKIWFLGNKFKNIRNWRFFQQKARNNASNMISSDTISSQY